MNINPRRMLASSNKARIALAVGTLATFGALGTGVAVASTHTNSPVVTVSGTSGNSGNSGTVDATSEIPEAGASATDPAGANVGAQVQSGAQSGVQDTTTLDTGVATTGEEAASPEADGPGGPQVQVGSQVGSQVGA